LSAKNNYTSWKPSLLSLQLIGHADKNKQRAKHGKSNLLVGASTSYTSTCANENKINSNSAGPASPKIDQLQDTLTSPHLAPEGADIK
jgi:hypothetical protein